MANHAAALQAALANSSGSDAGAQLLIALASTIQQQSAQTATLIQQVQQLEQQRSAPVRDTSNILVDTKTLGRVEKFKGLKKDCQDWSFSFKAFLTSNSMAVEALSWAVGQTDPITEAAIDLEANCETIHKLNGQIYTALNLLVQGDCLDKPRQRRNVAYYEPMNPGHKLKVLHRIIDPKVPLGMGLRPGRRRLSSTKDSRLQSMPMRR